MMNRRELILLLGGAMAATRPLRAQQKTMPVIAFLSGVSPGYSSPLLAAFRQGLGEAGYAEGQSVAIEYRWAEFQYDRLPALATDLVGRHVDAIATSGAAFSQPSRRRRRPRQSRSCSVAPAILSDTASSIASTGRATTLPA
jgi:putative tryptophan/tyrosine transport system substrate-binding protein